MAAKNEVEELEGECEHYDVLIVGAGMVGAALACSLLGSTQGSLRLAVVESAKLSEDSPYQPGFDVRSTALSAGSVEWFKALGLWSEIQQCATPIEMIHVSDQGKFGATRLQAQDMQVDALGYVVENLWLGRVFNQALNRFEGYCLEQQCKVESMQQVKQGMQLTLQKMNDEPGKKVTSSLVVLAEGGRSGLAETMGIDKNVTPYLQSAVIANVLVENPHKHVAYERFTEKGPLALLPLSVNDRQSRYALVWTQNSHEYAEHLLQCDEEEFLEALQNEFGYRQGRFSKVGDRKVFPLNLVEAKEQVRESLVLLGNAAHTLHPVAGQGFNLALRDSLALVDVITEALANNKNPGSLLVLQEYLARVQNDQLLTVNFSDHLTRLFSSENSVNRLVRKLGLMAVEMSSTSKQYLAKQAMGLGGRKPKMDLRAMSSIEE